MTIERNRVTEDGSPKRTLYSRLARIASEVHSDRVTRGERAELRRMRPDAIPPEVYWRLTDRLQPTPHPADEPFWLTVLPLMTRHPHRKGQRPGRVMAEEGVSPARVLRWLRRDRDSAWSEARRVLSCLGDRGIDWSVMGSLMARWQDTDLRRGFARDFFSARRRIERQTDDTQGVE